MEVKEEAKDRAACRISEDSIQRLMTPSEPSHMVVAESKQAACTDGEIENAAAGHNAKPAADDNSLLPPSEETTGSEKTLNQQANKPASEPLTDEDIKKAAMGRPYRKVSSLDSTPKPGAVNGTANDLGAAILGQPTRLLTDEEIKKAAKGRRYGRARPSAQCDDGDVTTIDLKATIQDQPSIFEPGRLAGPPAENPVSCAAIKIGNKQTKNEETSTLTRSASGAEGVAQAEDSAPTILSEAAKNAIARDEAVKRAACARPRPPPLLGTNDSSVSSRPGVAVYTPGGTTSPSRFSSASVEVAPSSRLSLCSLDQNNTEELFSPSSGEDPNPENLVKAVLVEEDSRLVEEDPTRDDSPYAVEAVQVKEKKFKTIHWVVLGVVALAIIAAVFVTVSKNGSGSSGNSDAESVQATVTAGAKASKTSAALVTGALQDCFMVASVTSTGQPGSLAVPDTSSLIPIVNMAREKRDCLFDVVVRSEDFHPRLHMSFASTHGLPPYAHATMGKGGLPITCMNTDRSASCCPTYWVTGKEFQDCDKVLCPVEANMTTQAMDHVLSSPACTFCRDNPELCFRTQQAMWPDHCIQGEEAGVPPSLFTPPSDIVLKVGDNDYVDGYSSFMDNSRNIPTPLDSILKSHGIETIYLMGIATDYGILYSTAHAIFLGYKVKVVLDATRYIAEDTYEAAVEQMRMLGATIISVVDLLAQECPSG